VFRPALWTTLTSTARKYAGTSKPQNSSSKPETIQPKAHNQRFIMNSIHPDFP
jgi:hypothetical protein